MLAAALVSKALFQVAKESHLKLRLQTKQLEPPRHSFLRAAGAIFPGDTHP